MHVLYINVKYNKVMFTHRLNSHKIFDSILFTVLSNTIPPNRL